MLAEPVQQLPSVGDGGIDWIYQPKVDGHRTILFKDGDRIRIRTRYDRTPIVDVSEIQAQAAELRADTAILDGEVAAVDKRGIPNWEALQRRDSAYPLRFFPFDLLYRDGVSLLTQPLFERLNQAAAIVADTDFVFLAPEPGTLATITRRLQKQGHEGIVAKDPNSIYHLGRRTFDWRKKPFEQRQECVIGGFKPHGNDSLHSLIVGVYEDGRLMFCSQVTAGLDPRNRRVLRPALELLRIPQCPFANLPTSKRRSRSGWNTGGVAADEMNEIVWVLPHLLAVIDYRQWLTTGLLRHARYAGWRLDKPAASVTREIAPAPRSRGGRKKSKA